MPEQRPLAPGVEVREPPWFGEEERAYVARLAS